jgi:hypothetical protein
MQPNRLNITTKWGVQAGMFVVRPLSGKFPGTNPNDIGGILQINTRLASGQIMEDIMVPRRYKACFVIPTVPVPHVHDDRRSRRE